MDGAEQVDQRALMEVYVYRDRGVFGMIRLYCRQTHGPSSEFASWQCFHRKTASGAAEAHGGEMRMHPSWQCFHRKTASGAAEAHGGEMRMHPYVGFGLCTDHICPDLFTIEDYATMGHRVMIIAHRNPGWSVEIKEKYFPPFVAPTTIGGDARVTTGSMALAGVTIGEVRVVGAVSAVKWDVEPHAVVAGNPASVVGRLERGTDTRSRIEPSNRPSRRVGCGQASWNGCGDEDRKHAA